MQKMACWEMKITLSELEVRVSEGSSYRESTVEPFSISPEGSSYRKSTVLNSSLNRQKLHLPMIPRSE